MATEANRRDRSRLVPDAVRHNRGNLTPLPRRLMVDKLAFLPQQRAPANRFIPQTLLMPISSLLYSGFASTMILLSQASMQTEVPPGPGGQATATATIVSGVLSYTSWPENNQPVTLCIAGRSPLTSRVTPRNLLNGRRMLVQRLESAGSAYGGCDAIFVGNVPLAEQRRIVRVATNAAVVTLDENSDGCVDGIMFCLRPAANGGMTFDLDIDAVSRSRVRVDPRVLSLGRRGARQ
jgi:hypothetical protein